VLTGMDGMFAIGCFGADALSAFGCPLQFPMLCPGGHAIMGIAGV
jgi:hypothetical protein